MAQKLFIGGLAFSTSTERLREVFTAAGHHAGATDLEELDNRLSLFVRKTPDAVQGAVDRVEIPAHSSGWLSGHDCILFIFYITHS